MTTNDVSLRMLRSRARQAEAYGAIRSQIAQADVQARQRAITLPTLKSVYGGRPVTYENGRLMAGGVVVRVRRVRP